MSRIESVITIFIIVLGTMTTRFLPFIIFPESKKPPTFIEYLGKVLPYAVMGLLIVYCLKDTLFAKTYGIIELVAILVVVLLHKWKRNMFISISVGTVFYMILIQNIV